MTDRELEQRIRAWYRTELDQQVAPLDLRASIVAIPSTEMPRAFGVRRPQRLSLLAAAAILAVTALVGALAVGSGLVHLSSVLPPAPSSEPSFLVTATEPIASPASTTPAGPLGGALIIAQGRTGPYDRGPFDLYAVDAGTGERQVLGTLPGRSYGYEFQRDADGRHVLVASGSGASGTISSVEAPTDASASFGFIASRDVAWIGSKADAANTNAAYARGYVLSPRGDRVATVHVDRFDHPFEIMVLEVGGKAFHAIPAPSGMNLGFVQSWSPDESAVIAVGCRPCNADTPDGPQTIAHDHLYIVPLNGSPWRELLDEVNGGLQASWSPDGSTLLVTHWECPPGSMWPRCPPFKASVSLVSVSDGSERPLTLGTETAESPVWSPDGTRIAFVGGRAGEIIKAAGIYVVNADGSGATKFADTTDRFGPVWSPDGRWLLYQNSNGQTSGWWLVPVGGGAPRLLGAYGGVSW
jgi:hypothetical protein